MNVAYCANECCLLNLETRINTHFFKAENKFKTSLKQVLKQAINQESLLSCRKLHFFKIDR